MFKEFLTKNIRLNNGDFSEFIYGHKGELLKLLEVYEELPTAKELYKGFLEQVIFRGDNLLPSRMEKKYVGICLTFCTYVGARKHVKGADKTCRRHDLGLKCNDLETRHHFSCNALLCITSTAFLKRFCKSSS